MGFGKGAVEEPASLLETRRLLSCLFVFSPVAPTFAAQLLHTRMDRREIVGSSGAGHIASVIGRATADSFVRDYTAGQRGRRTADQQIGKAGKLGVVSSDREPSIGADAGCDRSRKLDGEATQTGRRVGHGYWMV